MKIGINTSVLSEMINFWNMITLLCTRYYVNLTSHRGTHTQHYVPKTKYWPPFPPSLPSIIFVVDSIMLLTSFHFKKLASCLVILGSFPGSSGVTSAVRYKLQRYICDAMPDLVPFVQFKKREKHQLRSDTFSKVPDFSLKLCKNCHSSMGVFRYF